MWYGVFLWALVSSLFFHVPAGLLALFTLRHHKYGRFMSVSILLMGIVGPITAGILTSMLDIKIPVKTFHMNSQFISGPILETYLSGIKKKEWPLTTRPVFLCIVFFSPPTPHYLANIFDFLSQIFSRWLQRSLKLSFIFNLSGFTGAPLPTPGRQCFWQIGLSNLAHSLKLSGLVALKTTSSSMHRFSTEPMSVIGHSSFRPEALARKCRVSIT
ncbi:hypothetical protein HPG69_005038 [Diceros bicornis minor]|uniref:Transmembrane protein 170A n=1 Tax=Diceros bicornis minor TaxID=77932 RepID=A0A7J7ESE9_DICBM|nr:hypothetical protein HPG69_005038 [Diceros bicornis minor]